MSGTNRIDAHNPKLLERLNKVWVNLKHHGSIPGTQQVADARTNVDAFLAANTQAVFGVDHDTVTMADVVPQKPVRTKVRAAAVAEAAGDRQQAMDLLAEAFDELFNPQHHAYVDDAQDPWNIRRSPQAVIPRRLRPEPK